MPISVVRRVERTPNPWAKGGAQGAPEPAKGIDGPIVYEWVDSAGKPVVDASGKPARDVADLIDTAPLDTDDVVPWATIWRWCPASSLT